MRRVDAHEIQSLLSVVCCNPTHDFVPIIFAPLSAMTAVKRRVKGETKQAENGTSDGDFKG